LGTVVVRGCKKGFHKGKRATAYAGKRERLFFKTGPHIPCAGGERAARAAPSLGLKTATTRSPNQRRKKGKLVLQEGVSDKRGRRGGVVNLWEGGGQTSAIVPGSRYASLMGKRLLGVTGKKREEGWMVYKEEGRGGVPN